MSDPRRRLYDPKENPPPIILNREPEVRPPRNEQSASEHRPRSLTFREKLYTLFSPSSTRTRRVIITENRIHSRRRQRVERVPSPPPLPPPPPRTASSRVLDSPLQRAHRHSTSATMPEPYVPLPPRISPDAQNPRPTNPTPQRPVSADPARPIIEERSPERRSRIYAHPYDVREQIVESPPPGNRQPANYEVNQPVRSRPPPAVEAQELAQARAESHHREQQLEEAQRTIATLQYQLAQAARQTEQEQHRAAQIKALLEACENQRRLLEREKRVEAAEAQLARERSAEARAALEQERQDRSRERALQERGAQPQRVVRRPAAILQPYRPGEPRTAPSPEGALRPDTRAGPPHPRSNDAAMEAIRRAQEDARRGEHT